MNSTIIFNNALIITETHKLHHPLRRRPETGVYQFSVGSCSEANKYSSQNPVAVINGPVLQRRIARTSRLLEVEKERLTVPPAWRVLYSGETYADDLRNRVRV